MRRRDALRDGLWLTAIAALFRRKRVAADVGAAEVPEALRTVRHGHETTDASAKGLAIFAICMAVVLILIALAPIPILSLLSKTHDRPIAPAARAPLPPSPHLGPPGDAEIVAMRERDLHTLNSYGWTDRNAGIAHVPVESVIPRVAAELNGGAAGQPSQPASLAPQTTGSQP